jgi:putative transposase
MPRKPRSLQLAPEAALSRGHNREALFAAAEDLRYFLGLVARYRQRFGLRLYCVLSNHFHLLVQLDDPRRLSSLMAGLLLAYVRYFHQRYGFVGHLWQGRYKSPVVGREGYWLSCGRYIERNPVEAGLVVQPWDYPWSSCRAYALGEADPLVTIDPAYLELSPDPGRRQQLWREFLVGEDPREAHLRRGDWALGDDGFKQRMAKVLGRPAPRRRGRPRKTTEQVCQIVP